jgi:hypothetical protein
MVDDTWLSYDLPILTAIVEMEATMNPGMPEFDGHEVARRAGMQFDPEGYNRSLLRLADGAYIDLDVIRAALGGTVYCTVRGALQRGRRVTGQWPPDDAYLSLLAIFQERIDEAPDEPTKGRLRAALDGFLGVGKDIGVDLAAEWLKRMAMG